MANLPKEVIVTNVVTHETHNFPSMNDTVRWIAEIDGIKFGAASHYVVKGLRYGQLYKDLEFSYAGNPTSRRKVLAWDHRDDTEIIFESIGACARWLAEDSMDLGKAINVIRGSISAGTKFDGLTFHYEDEGHVWD